MEQLRSPPAANTGKLRLPVPPTLCVPMPPRWISLAFLLTIAAVAPPTTRADDIDPEKVRQAIEGAIGYLERTQNDDGSWPAWRQYDLTSLCTLALLNAGVEPQSPTIQRALTWLRNPARQPTTTYLVSLQTMALCAAEPRKDLVLIRKNARWLEEQQIKSGEMKGAWAYPVGKGDNSNAQFALLALHEAQRVGVAVQDETWRLALGYWQSSQNPDGSWDYLPGMSGTGSMTCAGICSIVIASGKLSQGDADDSGGRIQCCGDQQDNQHVERGLEWLGRNFSIDANPGANGRWTLYYLYGLERTGRLTARRFIGEHDWYREGTDKLVNEQDIVSGLWNGSSAGEDNPHIGTSLALLFLAKGRRPVLMAKLKHGPPESNDWNHHRSDAASLTAYVETRWKRDLSWQTISMADATADDLSQAPVLYLSGEQAPRFDERQARRLREYIQRGGFIFAEACCDGGHDFDKGFRALMDQVFPEPEFQLRLLEDDHPVWYAEEKVDPAHMRPLWGINFGCRTSVVYCPPDPADRPRPSLSCLWELAQPDHQRKRSKEVQEQIDAGLSIGINVLAYATNREVKYKYENFRNRELAKADPNDRGKLYIAKLKHSGGWNVAPGALLALQESLIREQHARVSTQPREVSISDPTLFNYHLVFMHGRNDFRLTQGERDQLRLYIERGGMVLADSVCASDAFARAFRREMGAIFPDRPLEKIPADHPMFTPAYGGFDLQTVTRREPRKGADGAVGSALRQVEPHLEGVRVGERYSVIFSPYDLSCALENHESMECLGYTRADAARIGLNVIMYSLQE
jgi:hypothetical protein